VALPLPNCGVEVSVCADTRLLNELDGFDLDPRLAIPFTGPIDPASVSARSVFVVRLAAGPPEAIGVERLVHDPATHTLYARPDTLLEPETRYGLVVTRELRDRRGRPIGPAPAFHAFLAAGERRAARGYRDALRRLMAGLERRGLRAGDVAVAAAFTTGSVTGFLEQARDELDRHPPAGAVITAPDGGGRAAFARAALKGLVLRRQVRAAPGDADAFRDTPLPLAAVPPAIGTLGVGWYWSPWYLGRERRIPDSPSGRPLLGPALTAPVPFVVLVPAGTPPPGGWPLALMGHGYGGEMFASSLLVAGTLARHGIATAALTVVGHGGGPGGRLLVERAAGGRLEVHVPGRGTDLDRDGAIGVAEGLGALAGGPSASLGLRDGLRQQVVDLMAFVRALRSGLDVDGDGVVDVRGDDVGYVGQSLGGIYGTLLLAVDPRIRAGVLNVPGGPIAEVARLSPVFRPSLRQVLAGRTPPLAPAAGGFHDDLPLRGDPPVPGPPPSALAIQEYLARAEWLARRGDPVAYARHLRSVPLPGVGKKRVLVQLAWGDGVVPNPTSVTLVRAGQLGDATTLLRYDRVAERVLPELREPHPFLLRIAAPGVAGAIARAAQEQAARFLADDDGPAWDPDQAEPSPFGAPLFEVPAERLPDR
jgi:hypothetical protein